MISASSRSRPTNRDAWLRSGASSTATSRNAGTGSAFPFSSSGSTGSATTASRTSACVASPINTSPAAAACSKRAATFTASPVASRSSVPVTTSPVFTPIRPLIPNAGNASRISPAARHARSASSSCVWGIPNTAITASPMNFSTVPAVRIDDRLHPFEVPRHQRPSPPRDPSARPARSTPRRRRTTPSPSSAPHAEPQIQHQVGQHQVGQRNTGKTKTRPPEAPSDRKDRSPPAEPTACAPPRTHRETDCPAGSASRGKASSSSRRLDRQFERESSA